MIAEAGLLRRSKTWNEEGTWSEKSTEIVHLENEICHWHISTGEILSYGFIGKIIYGIW